MKKTLGKDVDRFVDKVLAFKPAPSKPAKQVNADKPVPARYEKAAD